MSSEKADSSPSDALSATASVNGTGTASCKAVSLKLTLAKPKIYRYGAIIETVTCTILVEPAKYARPVTLTWTPAVLDVSRLDTFRQLRNSGDNVITGLFSNGKLYIKPTAAGDVTLTLAATEETSVAATVTLTIEDVTIAIQGEDGAEAPKSILEGHTRVYNAVITPADQVPRTYEWSRLAGNALFDIEPSKNKAKATVKPRSSVNGASAKIQVSAQGLRYAVTAAHQFDIVTVEIKDADGRSEPAASIINGMTQKFAALILPEETKGTLAWQVSGGHVSCVGATDAAIVEVRGDSIGEAQELKLTYTIGGQSGDWTIPLAVQELGLAHPVLIRKLDRTNGTIATFDATGATANLTWKTTNEIGAKITGSGKQIKLKSTATGIAPITLTFKPGEVGRTVNGTAVFVDAWLKSFTCETASKKELTTASTAGDKKTALLLGLASDPAAWMLGKLTVEAEGAPAEVAALEPKATGTYAWTEGTFTRAAASQPDAHAIDKAAFALAALPKTADGKGPGAATVDEVIKVAYKLDTVTIEDTLTVKVHRHGCSRVHWARKGKTAVTADDRPLPCPHDTRPQWDAFKSAFRVGDPSEYVNGHQHGGQCGVCSSAGARTVNHYVELTGTALARARTVADAVVAYVKNNTDNATYRGLLTKALKTYLTGTGKMLGVLRGLNAQQAETWLYALSGKWPADGGWTPSFTFNRKSLTRTIPSYAGTDASYKSALNPVAEVALEDPFGKLGLCAAPALLNRARTLALTDLELAEVWVYIGGKEQFTHKGEIGSCNQCRRFLGRMLCEVGDVA